MVLTWSTQSGSKMTDLIGLKHGENLGAQRQKFIHAFEEKSWKQLDLKK